MPTATEAKTRELKQRQRLPLSTPTDLGSQATGDIAAAMNAILADVFALYVKTKNFHWHMSGPHFRDGIASPACIERTPAADRRLARLS